MKKLLFAGAVVLSSLSLYSCGGEEAATTEEVDGTVIESDTTISELEVETTVRDVDTTVETETETIEPTEE